MIYSPIISDHQYGIHKSLTVTHFWCQSFKECRWTLVPQQVFHNDYARHLPLEIGVLNAGLDGI